MQSPRTLPGPSDANDDDRSPLLRTPDSRNRAPSASKPLESAGPLNDPHALLSNGATTTEDDYSRSMDESLRPPPYASDVHATGLLHAGLANRKLRRRPNEEARKEKESQLREADERATAAEEKHTSAQRKTVNAIHVFEVMHSEIQKKQTAINELQRKLEETQGIAQVQERICRDAKGSESLLEEESKRAVEDRDQAQGELRKIDEDEEKKRRDDEELEEQINRNSEAIAKSREDVKKAMELLRKHLDEREAIGRRIAEQ
ncbi:hypothetical protein H2201_004967 [Coniosporium apollinis]|uniref:GDP/GTP exchange factor Sec2 N-terminal domain-containing protein n=1 Tax=Coniosporium apollinis TaxID=61459 RepID=A0ABQ9NUB8_9PEZI|nr:hypothetical protein H2201_004967 [Coniosporium apollinis]